MFSGNLSGQHVQRVNIVAVGDDENVALRNQRRRKLSVVAADINAPQLGQRRGEGFGEFDAAGMRRVNLVGGGVLLLLRRRYGYGRRGSAREDDRGRTT